MSITRRGFIGAASAAAVCSSSLAGAADAPKGAAAGRSVTKGELDRILEQPVLKTDFLKEPVIVESIELLRHENNFLLRTRSKAGVEAISVPNSARMRQLYPLFLSGVMPVVLGKDARNLEALLWDVYRHDSNYKYQGLALWICVAALEMALLELLGQTAQQPVADFFGGALRRDIPIYTASGVRGNRPEEEIENLRRLVAASGAKALKFRLGGRMNRNVDSLPGRTEALIPLARKAFPEPFVLYADSNSSYDVANAIRIGRLMEEHNYGFYEEPVPFDEVWETKEVADALEKIPVAGGEQEFSMRRFQWAIEHRGLDIVQPDLHYFGGFIRSTKVARMAAAAGMTIVPHMSGGSLGYLEVVHFAAFTPNIGPYQEFKGNTDLPIECSTSSLKAENGVVLCPTGPGFGVRVDPEFVAKCVAVRA